MKRLAVQHVLSGERAKEHGKNIVELKEIRKEEKIRHPACLSALRNERTGKTPCASSFLLSGMTTLHHRGDQRTVAVQYYPGRARMAFRRRSNAVSMFSTELA